MIRFSLFFVIILSIIFCEPFNGLTLISKEGFEPNSPALTQLIDNNENIINEWIHDTGLSGIAYLSPDSILYVGCKIDNPNGPNRNGRFKKMNWEGEVVWDYIIPEELCRPHHDIEIKPNGNILVLCSELRTYEELLEVGMIIDQVPDINVNRGNMDMVVEIEPLENNLANIVWEWRFWDHLIQNVNPNLDNYGIVSENPQLLNVNSPSLSFLEEEQPAGADANDWMHCNSISYNPLLSQIMLSSRNRCEFYVIDQSTTINEASSNSGGFYGKGGDFLYRWGNPQNYDRGDANDQILKGQHSVIWIPYSFPGQGNILLFNNFHNSDYSTVLELVPPIDQNGSYLIDQSNAFEPSSYFWIYALDHLAAVRGGVWRLPNGNTIITTYEQLFEIGLNNNTEWIYNGVLSPSRTIKYSLEYFNEYNLVYDLNNDGAINNDDLDLLISLVVTNDYSILDADINHDASIDIFDLLLFSNFLDFI
tara:strand:- start:1704 stop:3137 length:1434 start_codon:yes stop_codon:yes gene_type:complete